MHTDSTHVKAMANKHNKQTARKDVKPKAYLAELSRAVDDERKELGRKPFDRDDDDRSGGTRVIQQSGRHPENGQPHREGKPDGFHYSERRTA